jgi:hypothetical protein
MEKYVELIKLLEKIFGKGAVSRTIGTRTNVVRFPKGKQPIDPTRSELDVEGSAAKNPDLAQTIENSIADRMGDITKMNDQELLTYTANVRRLVNFKEPPPLPDADVVKFGSGEEIKGKGLEQLIEKQGTKNPPTTVAGRLEAQGKKLEKAGEDLKEITEPKSVIGDIIKDYGDFDKYMQSSQKTGYVRATVRQIMREDIQAGKLKLPKELQDQVMQGIGEPIDIYRKVYGEGALEQIDSLADDLGQFRTEEEAAKFARSKYQMEPKLEPVDESMTYDELGNLIKKGTDEPEGKAEGGIIGYANNRSNYFIGGFIKPLIARLKGVVSPVQPTPSTPEIPLTLLERYQKYLSEAQSPTTVNTDGGFSSIIGKLLSKVASPQGTSTPNDQLYSLYKKNLEQKADGGRIGYAKGKRVKSSIDKLIDQLNKKTQGKKSMESVNPKTGEVTVPKKPIRRAEEPTGVTVMDPEPDIVDERSIKVKTAETPSKAGQGTFTKQHVLERIIQSTIDANPTDEYVQTTFPNFIKELRANPELAKNENVWNNLTQGIPENKRLVVYGDDTVDFFSQGEDLPRAMQQTQDLSNTYGISMEEATRIKQMEPTDQVMEIKKLEVLKKRTEQAEGGIAGLL